MKYFYDRRSDSLYLSFAERNAYRDSIEAAPGVVLDFDDQGQLVGIDLERASRIVDVSDLGLHEEPSGADAEVARLDGSKLRREREQLGLSQLGLARKLSVSPNTIARWERGELKIEHPGMLQLALRALRSSGAAPRAPGSVRQRSDLMKGSRARTKVTTRNSMSGEFKKSDPQRSKKK